MRATVPAVAGGVAATGEVEAVLGPAGSLARAMAGYEHRPSQLQMARAVARALDGDSALLVEAGTGTGKTLAYLVPALASGRKVIVSTGTRTLQDQIMGHDLPLLEAHLGDPLPVACLKGLSNYVCLRRYHELAHSARSVSGRRARQLPLLQAWLEHTETGDRAELSALPEGAAVWADVHSGSDTRIGPRCKHYDDCYVTRARAEAERARLVVVNHHLFFADLALRGPHGGGVLPDYDAVVFDEAHLLEDIATDFFGISVSSRRVEVLVRDAERALFLAGLGGKAARLLADVTSAAAPFFSALPRAAGPASGRLPLDPAVFEERVAEPMYALDTALEGLVALCRQHVDRGEAVAQLARRAQALRDDVATIAAGGGRGQVTWTAASARAVRIGASPVDVGEILREKLFYTGVGVVLTSATLSAGGSFEFVRSRLGIDDADELALPSPFAFAEQAALYLPAHLPDPRAAGYEARAAAEIRDLVELTDGGAFVLCTSIRMMRALHRSLASELALCRSVLLQGEAPNATLLSRFREAGDAVLFATASFWQGVDVPGHALRLVIIDKLPFDVPTDPLVVARCERLEAEGKAPFMKYLVPAAALSLKQGFGRLIRSSRDRGIVAILDSRITRKGYGKVFLRSLPPARRCTTLSEVSDFWEDAQ